jgi:hypothetical protein
MTCLRAYSRCPSQIATEPLGRYKPRNQRSQESLLPFASLEALARESDLLPHESFQRARVSHGECTRIHDALCCHFEEANRRQPAQSLECRFVRRSRQYEFRGSDKALSRFDRSRRSLEPARSKRWGHQSPGTASTCFDVVGYRPDFKKDLTFDSEMLETTSRLTASSAISLAVNCEMGRSDSSSGFSQAIAPMAACCSGVNSDAWPFRG